MSSAEQKTRFAKRAALAALLVVAVLAVAAAAGSDRILRFVANRGGEPIVSAEPEAAPALAAADIVPNGTLGDKMFDATLDHVVGDGDAAVTVVEFFDYQCDVCRRLSSGMARFAGHQPGVRFVFKEYPIFGGVSIFAARAALAARRQGLYQPLHMALFRRRGALTDQAVLRIAEGVGLDMARLRADMADPTLTQALRDNLRLGLSLGFRGTPGFVVGDQIIRGGIDLSTLRRMVARAGAS